MESCQKTDREELIQSQIQTFNTLRKWHRSVDKGVFAPSDFGIKNLQGVPKVLEGFRAVIYQKPLRLLKVETHLLAHMPHDVVSRVPKI
jgi:hypothetical protein